MTAKLLFILNDLTDISLNNSIFKIANQLSDKSINISIISLKSKGMLKSKFSKIKNCQLTILNQNFLSNWLKLLSEINNIKPHIIVSQTLRADYTIFLVKKISSSQTIFSHIAIRRNYFFRNNFIKNILYFFSTHLTDHNICVAKHLKYKLTNQLKISPKKITVISNGVQLAKISPQTKHPPLITFTGRLIKRKNISYLINALSKVKVNYQCQIIGQGPQKNRLQHLINKLKLNHQITLLGHKSNISSYLDKTSIFIMPSKNEAQSWSILEAMSFSIPCLVSNIQANKELITHQEHGLVFSLKNKQQLSSQITQLLTFPLLRKKLGNNAYRKIKDQHQKSTMIKKYRDFFLNYTKDNF